MELIKSQFWKLGDQGPVIRIIQTHLRTHGYMITLDGDFGPETDSAVRAFQLKNRLIVDGIVGAKTYEALLGRTTEHFLGGNDISQAAELLDVDSATVYTVKEIESLGNGYLPDGRVIILYERHIMRRRLLANGFSQKEVTELIARYPGLVNTATGGYRGNAAEHYRLNNALKIHPASAMESCSWGLFQIMGFHWERLEYPSAVEFVIAMSKSEANQLDAFVRFVKTDPPLWEALKAQDWAAFARRYNGPGYKKNRYDTRLAEAYARHQEQAA
ncbi:MAG: N-acetylmuramidase domain-containing protein [Nitrincola lacisaponensis]|uniref:N-acetylmuramidase domain-containing protein n=1 Tax=Nitrincola lacisaponensis TaxID=267850 RepID=UPI00391B9B4C